MKKSNLITFLLYIFFTVTELAHASFVSKKILSISIPKCGSNLLVKCLELLTHRKMYDFFPKDISATNIQQLLNNASNGRVGFSHLYYLPEYRQAFDKKDCAIFFIYRDPRDQIISMIYHLLLWHDHLKWPDIKKYTFEELIFEFIKPKEAVIPRPPNHRGILDFYQRYLGWISCENICTVRFEDLIGPIGGGLYDLQINTIARITQHLDISLNEDILKFVLDNLHGATTTFRKGTIGQWKEYFTLEHKQAFKEEAGQLLIDLGYEKNFDW